jgi:MtaA/CmuA family methyltransferase
VEGALAECCDLMNMQEVFINMLDEPEAVEHLIDICTEQGILFAKAQVEAGAHIIGIGDAATSLIGPALYEEFVLPYQQKMIKAVHDAGAKVKLHICGNINPVMDLIAQTGTDMIDLDFMVDIERAAQILPQNMCICGNFNPVTVLYQGTPETVKAEVRRCKQIRDKNWNFISAGCEVPRDTPLENMIALKEAMEEE